MALAKAALRKEMKNRLSSISMEEKRRQSSVVSTAILGSTFYKTSKRVCVYLSMDNEEVSTAEILKDIFNTSRKQCFVPRYTKEGMEMLELKSLEDYANLPLTKWNIKQPSGNENRQEAIASGGLDLILVPGLAFSADGKRLGRGKGYYDTYLKKFHNTPNLSLPVTIALAFKEQLVEDIPTADHDVPINHIFHP